MSLCFYNTLTRKKEAFEPQDKKTATLYHCGPTVYHFAHIGNLRAFVFADILRRTIEYQGYTVKQIMNITDVGHLVSDEDSGEDKMEKGARREGKKASEIALFYTNAFFTDIDALNIKRAAEYPRATEHITDEIALIETLEKKGFTYFTSDGVYFDTSKYGGYGELAKLNLAEQKEGTRVATNPEKRNSSDFALWKFSPRGSMREQEWESPWGRGFPGWHIECSAMAMEYLGETIDIHTGGIDHIPVHHTNERAQSVCATGKPFARFWMHSGFVNVASGKMAKSADNFLRLQTLIDKGFSPFAYRYLLLTAHYRTTLEFSLKSLLAAENALARIYDFQSRSTSNESSMPNKLYMETFFSAVRDDLDTPKALATMWMLFQDNEITDDIKHATFLEFDRILGLDLKNAQKYVKESISPNDLPKKIQDLLRLREKARVKKDFEESDRLRNELLQEGFTVNDTENGQMVRRRGEIEIQE